MTDPKRVLIGKRYVDDKFAATVKLLDERVAAVRREEELFRSGLKAHLETLNHETERINTIASETVSQEKFDGAMKAIDVQMKAIVGVVVTAILAVAGWLIMGGAP
jgi:hypothetical protein